MAPKKAKKLGNILYVVRIESPPILAPEKAKNLGKYKIFLMPVYMIYFYSKRFRFAPSFNKIKKSEILGPMWHTNYASAVPKNLGVGLSFWLCSEGCFLSRRS